jgi:hypothetical protein
MVLPGPKVRAEQRFLGSPLFPNNWPIREFVGNISLIWPNFSADVTDHVLVELMLMLANRGPFVARLTLFKPSLATELIPKSLTM